MSRITARLLPIVALTLIGAATLPLHAAEEGPLATIDGQPITRADVEGAAAQQLQQLQNEYDKARKDILQQGLDALVTQRLIEAGAKKEGVTAEALVGRRVTAVTDADIDTFYEQNKARIQQPKEQILPQIKAYLEQQRRAEATSALVSELRQKHEVRMLIEPARVAVAASGPARGPEAAPVTLVAFSDFQCPFCSRLNPTLDQLVERYGDKVRVVFRQFPLHSIHPNAQKAAEASLCANEQGKFWQLHDAMFADQNGLGVAELKKKAGVIGLDQAKFDACLDSGAKAAAVKADLDAGMAAGVGSTPALFVNGRPIEGGAVPIDKITPVIDDELQRVAQKPAAAAAPAKGR